MAGGIRESAGGGDDDLDVSHEINVTPFIDVILVLLIIFMVAAPLSTVDIDVDLPASNAAPQPRPDEPIFVTVRADLTLALGNGEIARDALGGRIDDLTESDKKARIFLRADKAVSYGDLMEVMNLLRRDGYTSLALVGLESVPGGETAAGPSASADASPSP